MKKILLFTLPLLLLLGCGDKEDEIIINHPIVGKWELVDFESVIDTDNKELTDAIKDYIARTHEKVATDMFGGMMDFKGTGKVIIGYGGLQGTLTYKMEGNVLSINLPNGDMQSAPVKITAYNDLRIYEDIREECEKELLQHFPSNAVIKEVKVVEVYKRK